MKNAMDTEAAIERVLTGLRDAEASAGLERRVLRAVEERSAQKTGERWRFSPAAAIALGLALAVGLGVLVMMHSGQESRGVDQAAVQPRPVRMVASVSGLQGAQNVRVPVARPARRKTTARRLRVASREDSIAQREMRAASRPAPPMPLTEQERLLVRVAREDRPQAIAMLDAGTRAKELAKEDAEFQRFVNQSKMAEE